MPAQYIVVGGTAIGKNGIEVELVIGPYDEIAAADEIKGALDKSTAGRHKIMQMHYLEPRVTEAEVAGK